MIKDPIAACHAYAKENASALSTALTVTLKHDVDTYMPFAKTWENGVPVTKMFEREDDVPIFIPKGTTLVGVAYTGRSSGDRLFEFIYGSHWYRTYQIDDDDECIFECEAHLL